VKQNLIDLYEKSHQKAWLLWRHDQGKDLHTMTMEIYTHGLLWNIIGICNDQEKTQGTASGAAQAIRLTFGV
jgi:3-methyladenine DNA glycosylase Tag